MIKKNIDRSSENGDHVFEKFSNLEIRLQENILSYVKEISAKLDGKAIYITNILITKDGYDVSLTTGNLFI